ncbi:protein WAVE-DAMPENED 2-like [Cynara cardunculus var. scolymus]|uniref:protein WAVE-DAMPENED 2-like n=1 Tax=Cynara cardunculus var. scolymus TaxID=59895 RepID=UPI000D62E419|nr:protein WAVE-DAMPENED 2-like [Cynara cardunculus var. scolymus]
MPNQMELYLIVPGLMINRGSLLLIFVFPFRSFTSDRVRGDIGLAGIKELWIIRHGRCGKVMGNDDDGSPEDEDKSQQRYLYYVIELATFVQIAKTRGVTVGVAPSFRSAERAEKRKEYYTKLEQRHQALEAEKMEAKMRTMEEEEAALKQFRKNLFVKAHPVPSFYREGPPPKSEPKKIPVTRAKSPKLTRRRSCDDSCHTYTEDKGSCSRTTTRRARSTTPNPVRNK